MNLPLRELEGKYEILHKMREGGMGALYKVRHRLLDEVRVVKVIRPQFAAESDLQERFLREAQAAIRLRHPNIAQLYDFAVDHDGTTSYMVMEYIDGVALDELLLRCGPPGLGLALEVAEQGLRAIDYLHRCGYIHRDLSPDNLMLARDVDGRPLVKLLDLGIVKRMGAAEQLTQTGMFVGKLRYASPEQLGGGAAGPDRRSDLYSFGILLYELLTGVCPIAGSSLSEMVGAHMLGGPIPFETSDPKAKVPDELRRIVLRMLARRAEDRPESAAEVVGELAAMARPQPAELRRRFEKLMARAAKELPRAGDYPKTGSTQGRLDARFAPAVTPPPEPSLRRVAPAAEPDGVAELLESARLLARLEQPAKAARELQRLLQLDPGHDEARRLLGTLGGAGVRPRRSASARSVAPAGAEDATVLADVDELLAAASRQLESASPQSAEATLLALRARAPADPRVAALAERLERTQGSRASDGAGRSPAAVAAGEPLDERGQRLAEARHSIDAALEAGDLARAGRELAFADEHYGLGDALADLRTRFDRIAAARRTLDAWTSPAPPAAGPPPSGNAPFGRLARWVRRPR